MAWNKNLSNKEILNRLLYLQNAIECGVHSGIEPCCVKFFITEKMWMQDKKCKNYYSKMKKRASELGFRWWGYIPCPSCLKDGNLIKMCPCPITCGKRSGLIKQSLIDVKYGFDLIRSGKAPVAGSVAAIVANSLTRIMIF
jgi:hypothetical protein